MMLFVQDREQLKIVGRVGSIGIEMGLSVIVGFLGGRWLDGWLGTEPILMWVGLGFGLAAGFKSLYQLIRRLRRELDHEDEQDTPEDPG